MSHTNTFRRPPRRQRAHFTSRRRATLVAALSAMLVLDACLDSSSLTSAPTLTPAAMVLVGGGAQLGAAGNTLPMPVVIRVTDQSGLPVSYATVSFTPTASSGTVSAAEILTDTTGSAGVFWTLGTGLGADSLSVSVAGLPTITVTATVTPSFPDSIAIVSGAGQSAPAGTTLSAPLLVRVTDQFGYAVPNASVNWSSDANGTFTSAGAVTGPDGSAQAVYTLGPTAGVQHVKVVVSTPAGAMLTTISVTGT